MFQASDETFRDAAEIALTGASAREHNHFKIELAKRTIVRACVTALLLLLASVAFASPTLERVD